MTKEITNITEVVISNKTSNDLNIVDCVFEFINT